jgi:hypothetical protein
MSRGVLARGLPPLLRRDPRATVSSVRYFALYKNAKSLIEEFPKNEKDQTLKAHDVAGFRLAVRLFM